MAIDGRKKGSTAPKRALHLQRRSKCQTPHYESIPGRSLPSTSTSKPRVIVEVHTIKEMGIFHAFLPAQRNKTNANATRHTVLIPPGTAVCLPLCPPIRVLKPMGTWSNQLVAVHEQPEQMQSLVGKWRFYDSVECDSSAPGAVSDRSKRSSICSSSSAGGSRCVVLVDTDVSPPRLS